MRWRVILHIYAAACIAREKCIEAGVRRPLRFCPVRYGHPVEQGANFLVEKMVASGPSGRARADCVCDQLCRHRHYRTQHDKPANQPTKKPVSQDIPYPGKCFKHISRSVLLTYYSRKFKQGRRYIGQDTLELRKIWFLGRGKTEYALC